MILAAASARVSTTVALRRSSSSLGQRPAPQRLHHPENYLLPSDWAAMEDKTFTRRYHLQVLCDRLSLVGLRNPSESTFAAMAGLMQTVLGDVGDATSAYDLLQQLKQTWRASPCRAPHLPLLHDYPALPGDLPTECQASAYPSGAPTNGSRRTMTGHSGVVPMRSTNKRLRLSGESSSSGASSSSGLGALALAMPQMPH